MDRQVIIGQTAKSKHPIRSNHLDSTNEAFFIDFIVRDSYCQSKLKIKSEHCRGDPKLLEWSISVVGISNDPTNNLLWLSGCVIKGPVKSTGYLPPDTIYYDCEFVVVTKTRHSSFWSFVIINTIIIIIDVSPPSHTYIHKTYYIWSFVNDRNLARFIPCFLT